MQWLTVHPLLDDGAAEEHHLDFLAPLQDVLPKIHGAYVSATDSDEHKKLERVVYASINKQGALPRNAHKAPAQLCKELLKGQGGELVAMYMAGQRDDGAGSNMLDLRSW